MTPPWEALNLFLNNCCTTWIFLYNDSHGRAIKESRILRHFRESIMATTKTVYTIEQTIEMVEAYKAKPTQETVALFAEKFGKTLKSIIAKLSREGCYIKKAYVSKAGSAPVKKDELANEFQELFHLTEAESDSLTKANKSALTKVLIAYKEALKTVMAE